MTCRHYPLINFLSQIDISLKEKNTFLTLIDFFSEWGGSNDLTAAAGWERDGETIIMFRKKLEGNGFTDHEIINENMHVIWAVGQEPGDFSHSPSSGLEKGTPSIPDFYKKDELKYHGKKNRGKVDMNFFDEVKRFDNF